MRYFWASSGMRSFMKHVPNECFALLIPLSQSRGVPEGSCE